MEWTRLENEEEVAYKAFKYYLDLDKSKRTIVNAYASYKKDNIRAQDAIPKEWYDWSKKYKWKNRSEAYDNEIKQQVADYNTKDQMRDLIEFRKSQKALAKLLTETGRRAIEAARTRLESLNPEEIQVRDLAGILKAGVSILSVGQQAHTEALALDELVQVLSDNQNVEQDEIGFTYSTYDASQELIDELFEE